MADWIAAAAIAAGIVAVLYQKIKRRKAGQRGSGCGDCAGNCAGCGGELKK